MNLSADLYGPLTDDDKAEPQPAAPKAPPKIPILPVPDDAPPLPSDFRFPGKGAIVAKWEYRDATGRLLGYDARLEWTGDDGETHKDVMPITFCQVGDKRGWRWKSFPDPRPLYGLDRLAYASGAPVIIAEGCKTAEAASLLLPDHVVVSWPGGGNAVSKADWAPLKGRDVTIWPDRDRQSFPDGEVKPYDEQPGTIAADAIASRIREIAETLSILDLEDWECADGWDAADALADGWDETRAAEFVASRTKEVDLVSAGTIMPTSFEYGEDGIYSIGGESETKRQRICGRVKVLAKTRDINGMSWGLLLELRDDDGRVHRWAVPRTVLAGDGTALREALLDRGLFVSTSSTMRAKLSQFFSEVNTTVKARAVNTVGWAGRAFVLPDFTVGDTPTERVIFQNAQAGAHEYGSSGTLAQWQEHVAKPAIGNSRYVFMLAASFVGPVLEILGEEGGGFNFVGSSSCGKTSILRGAVSVWGGRKFMRTWRATDNALEGICAQHSQTTLYLDEIGQLDPNVAGATAYMMVNGESKGRQNRSGGNRATVSWNVLFLSTGERGLADLVKEAAEVKRRGPASAAAGQEVRIVDIPADAGKQMGVFEELNGAPSAEAFARQIKSAAAEYYGTAAIAYLEDLATIWDSVGDVVSQTVARFVGKYVRDGSDGQVLRASRRFGLVAAAGELAIARGILPWPRDEAYKAAGVLFTAWVDRRGGTGSSEDRNVISRLRLFLQQHGDSRFEPVGGNLRDDPHFRPIHNRAGYWRHANGDDGTYREYLCTKDQFGEIFAGMDHSHVVKVLRGRTIIGPDKQGKSAHSIRLPDGGQARCYIINAEQLGMADDGIDHG